MFSCNLVFICILVTFYVELNSAIESPDDLYSESPCELRPLSSYKDPQGNLWGVGNGNLWWFNATNLSWSLLPLPNGTTSDPWRVVCGDPKRYVAVLGVKASLILHLPWQHWQIIDSDDVPNNHVDMNVTWCWKGNLYSVDTMRERLYILEPDEAHWTALQETLLFDNDTLSAQPGIANTWVGPGGQLFLLQSYGEHNHLVSVNATEGFWHIVAEKNNDDLWPEVEASDLSISINHGSNNMWFWMEKKGMPNLWFFNLTSNEWKEGHYKFTKTLPRLQNVLASWQISVNGDLTAKNCLLVRSSDCTAQYSASHTQCWPEEAMLPTTEDSLNQDASQKPTVATLPKQLHGNDVKPDSSKIHGPNCTLTNHVTSPMQMTTPGNPTLSYHITEHSVTSKVDRRPIIKLKTSQSEPKEDGVTIIPSRIASWHEHTSVFGSIVFFGTSITIFGMVGVFWCFRRCVHFPKDALLLRDPPSVRYTAIPDSLVYDSGRPSAYTVIPDSIA